MKENFLEKCLFLLNKKEVKEQIKEILNPFLEKFIIAHSLFITVFLGFAVSYKQYKIGNFYLKEVLVIGIPGMLCAYVVSEIVKASNWYDKLYFDIIFLSLLVLLAVRLFYINPHKLQFQFLCLEYRSGRRDRDIA